MAVPGIPCALGFVDNEAAKRIGRGNTRDSLGVAYGFANETATETTPERERLPKRRLLNRG